MFHSNVTDEKTVRFTNRSIDTNVFRKTSLMSLCLVTIFYLLFGEHNLHCLADSSPMQKLQVVPDVLEAVPPETLEVTYTGEKKVDMGNVLTPTQVKNMPTVQWTSDTNTLYTLCMTDPDAPSRQNPKFREWHHWLVVNIPGSDISKGDTLTEYVGSGPPKGTGLHRYVFVLYKQNGKIAFDEKKINNRTGNSRGKFSIRKLALKYKLGDPVAGNFFQAEWDDYVPKLYKQLGS